MSRPTNQGPKARATDRESLLRILKRAEESTKWPPKQKEQFIFHVKAALKLYLDTEDVLKKSA